VIFRIRADEREMQEAGAEMGAITD
jgi:hypothetical protein